MEDSGWRFMAGDEPDAPRNEADNLAVYDVNTIANEAPDIIALQGASAVAVTDAIERYDPSR